MGQTITYGRDEVLGIVSNWCACKLETCVNPLTPVVGLCKRRRREKRGGEGRGEGGLSKFSCKTIVLG